MTLNETWLCEAIQGRRLVSLWYDGGASALHSLSAKQPQGKLV